MSESLDAWWFGGYPLDQIANTNEGQHAIEQLAGAYNLPVSKGDNPSVSLREGRIHVEKFYDEQMITLGMHIYGRDAIDFLGRYDRLKMVFGKRDQQILKRRVADGSYRQALAEVVGDLRFRQLEANRVGRLTVDFKISDPFMRSNIATAPTPTTINSSPEAFTINNPGMVKDRSAIISLAGPLTNPRIDNLTNETWVSYTGVISGGATLVIDVGKFTAMIGSSNVLDNILHSGDPYFLPLEPGDNSIEVQSDVTTTGTVGFSFYAPYL